MTHPVHPLLVHFPIACWSLSTFGDIVGMFYPTGFTQAIATLMLIGIISGIAAMAAGLFDAVKYKHIEHLSNPIDKHMYAAITAWSFYLVSLSLRWDDALSMVPDMWAIVTSVAGAISVMVAGWYGGNLVYVHGVGTQKLKD